MGLQQHARTWRGGTHDGQLHSLLQHAQHSIKVLCVLVAHHQGDVAKGRQDLRKGRGKGRDEVRNRGSRRMKDNRVSLCASAYMCVDASAC